MPRVSPCGDARARALQRDGLTRSGELSTVGRFSLPVTEKRPPEEIDRVLACWQRLLWRLGADMRLYLHLLHRPVSRAAEEEGASGVAQASQGRRRAFLTGRVQQPEAVVAWVPDPRLRPAAEGSGARSRLGEWWRRKTGAGAS